MCIIKVESHEDLFLFEIMYEANSNGILMMLLGLVTKPHKIWKKIRLTIDPGQGEQSFPVTVLLSRLV